MRTFTLRLQDYSQVQRVEDVRSFIGEDAAGAFGIMAGHERMIGSLVHGLSRYRTADDRWHYLVMPGGLLYFLDNELSIASRHIFVDDDMDRILGELEARLAREEADLKALKENMKHLEQEMLRRIMRLKTGD